MANNVRQFILESAECADHLASPSPLRSEQEDNTSLAGFIVSDNTTSEVEDLTSSGCERVYRQSRRQSHQNTTRTRNTGKSTAKSTPGSAMPHDRRGRDRPRRDSDRRRSRSRRSPGYSRGQTNERDTYRSHTSRRRSRYPKHSSRRSSSPGHRHRTSRSRSRSVSRGRSRSRSFAGFGDDESDSSWSGSSHSRASSRSRRPSYSRSRSDSRPRSRGRSSSTETGYDTHNGGYGTDHDEAAQTNGVQETNERPDTPSDAERLPEKYKAAAGADGGVGGPDMMDDGDTENEDVILPTRRLISLRKIRAANAKSEPPPPPPRPEPSKCGLSRAETQLEARQQQKPTRRSSTSDHYPTSRRNSRRQSDAGHRGSSKRQHGDEEGAHDRGSRSRRRTRHGGERGRAYSKSPHARERRTHGSRSRSRRGHRRDSRERPRHESSRGYETSAYSRDRAGDGCSHQADRGVDSGEDGDDDLLASSSEDESLTPEERAEKEAERNARLVRDLERRQRKQAAKEAERKIRLEEVSSSVTIFQVNLPHSRYRESTPTSSYANHLLFQFNIPRDLLGRKRIRGQHNKRVHRPDEVARDSMKIAMGIEKEDELKRVYKIVKNIMIRIGMRLDIALAYQQPENIVKAIDDCMEALLPEYPDWNAGLVREIVKEQLSDGKRNSERKKNNYQSSNPLEAPRRRPRLSKITTKKGTKAKKPQDTAQVVDSDGRKIGNNRKRKEASAESDDDSPNKKARHRSRSHTPSGSGSPPPRKSVQPEDERQSGDEQDGSLKGTPMPEGATDAGRPVSDEQTDPRVSLPPHDFEQGHTPAPQDAGQEHTPPPAPPMEPPAPDTVAELPKGANRQIDNRSFESEHLDPGPVTNEDSVKEVESAVDSRATNIVFKKKDNAQSGRA
ncbi:hypothetical protein BJ508DRAFT_316239, partial [Ascobolus immersus RN42]